MCIATLHNVVDIGKSHWVKDYKIFKLHKLEYDLGYVSAKKYLFIK